MQLTDQEIREIILKEKRAKRRRKRVIKRVSMLLGAIILIIGVIVFIANKSLFTEPRGVIFIDPGHGGEDSGSYVGGRYEKDDTLRLSLAVKDDLENLGFKVYMSRETDVYVERADRGLAANEKKADLFISLHRNKADEGEGVEIYVPSKNENASNLLGENIMKALVEQGFMERTVRIGTLLGDYEDYIENKNTNMPSCLVEVGFLQDSGDNKLFDDNFENNALAIANAISDTFATLFEPEDIE